MKKRVLECTIHGLTLHRCKGICRFQNGKWYRDYSEKCYECMRAGKQVKKKKVAKQRVTHVTFR